jgi:hypothetical protein
VIKTPDPDKRKPFFSLPLHSRAKASFSVWANFVAVQRDGMSFLEYWIL